MKLSTLLNEDREKRGLTLKAHARLIGLKYASYYAYTQEDYEPNPKNYRLLAAYFGFDVHRLLNEEIDQKDLPLGGIIPTFPARLIPVLSKAECGPWVDFDDLGYPAGVSDKREYAPTTDPDAFYVIASGDSMTGSDIKDGDRLLVEPSREIHNGNVILARSDSGLTVKRFQEKNGTVFLIPTNESHEAIIITPAEGKKQRVKFYRVTKVVREV